MSARDSARVGGTAHRPARFAESSHYPARPTSFRTLATAPATCHLAKKAEAVTPKRADRPPPVYSHRSTFSHGELHVFVSAREAARVGVQLIDGEAFKARAPTVSGEEQPRCRGKLRLVMRSPLLWRRRERQHRRPVHSRRPRQNQPIHRPRQHRRQLGRNEG